MAAALVLAARGRGLSAPNPNVGCVIVRDGRVIGRGWTQPGGRPHAEAMALDQAGAAAVGATLYTTLEPCAHQSARGPACSDLLVAAGIARVVTALRDPDPRTDGEGHARIAAAGIAVIDDVMPDEARRAMAGFLTRRASGRPHVTLKLATSLDGCIALHSGASKWITGPAARAHGHLERARHEAILVGRATYDADAPKLDVRLAGLERRSPRRLLMTRMDAPQGWEAVRGPAAIREIEGVDHLLVEGGAQTAAAFLRDDLVDRLLLYRAPILLGGRQAVGDLFLNIVDPAHGRWRLIDQRPLGSDRLEVYERARS
ncbi:bifunctional diaminohydroxyphosphoribosylaminopyrimidine deaminase/5-amino-6-(5-phosphoribosylamino)uracil reductase RibD [Sphingomonas sp. S1-29]|nr:bifunctional diaminohydroxyphosphoribosylaminopyrimidine deaminase/5-amino-6-(5-phosphoribosylamino)uracil reductase RibD [Sphingomonas sp. S1-29]UZK71077.1 bifunctional diaminohydroxyphosphoribosylaminopyrimidine deaminase/5-amino-6-(5-phosphoribosylamino)uracil reductase RibD [Sphingomonas sp. S1-29]